MNKLLPILGIVALVIGGVLFFQSRKNTGGSLIPFLKKEISVGTEVCREFPKEWVEDAIGKSIIKVEPFDMTGTHVCNYFASEHAFVAIHFEDLSVEINKKGHEEMGHTIKTDSRIPMEHYIAWQENGLINGIYLVLGPNKFIMIDRSSGEILIDNEQDIEFAIQVAKRLQSGENVVQGVATPTSKPVTTGANHQALAQSYLKALSEKKIPEAIAMMTSKAVPDDSTKQAWGVQFNAFEKLTVKSITPAMLENWTESLEEYLIIFDVVMTAESANGPIPYYGYENGTNDRWLTLEKENGEWKVAGISTGP